MKETGILNSDVSQVISTQGHMDEMIVCDGAWSEELVRGWGAESSH